MTASALAETKPKPGMPGMQTGKHQPDAAKPHSPQSGDAKKTMPPSPGSQKKTAPSKPQQQGAAKPMGHHSGPAMDGKKKPFPGSPQ